MRLPARLRSRHGRESYLLAVGLIVQFYTLQIVIASDGLIRYQALMNFLRTGSIPDVKYSLIQPLLTLPLAAFAHMLSLDVVVAAGYFNLVVFLAFLLVCYRRLGAIAGHRITMTFLLIVTSASMFPHHLQWYFGEVLTAALLWIGFLTYHNDRPLIPVLSIGIAVANTPALLPALAVAALARLLRARDARLVACVALASLWFVFETILKFGSLGDSPYLSDGEAGRMTVMPYSGRPGYSYPIFFGVLSILFSFGKGLFFFIPGLFLPLATRLRHRLGKLNLPWDVGILFTLVAICTYGMWWSWYGGSFWGPRFFLFLCPPASLILAVSVAEGFETRQRQDFALVILALIQSVWVGINGCLYGQAHLDICRQNDYAQEFLCWYTPEFSVLWRPFVVGFEAAIPEHLPFALWQAGVLAYLLACLVWKWRSRPAEAPC